LGGIGPLVSGRGLGRFHVFGPMSSLGFINIKNICKKDKANFGGPNLNLPNSRYRIGIMKLCTDKKKSCYPMLQVNETQN